MRKAVTIVAKLPPDGLQVRVPADPESSPTVEAAHPAGDGSPPWRSRDLFDRVTAALVLLLGVVLLAESAHYGLLRHGQPGPGLFPGIVSGCLVVVTACWLVMGAGPERDPKQAVDDDELPDEEPLDAAGLRRIGFVVAWTAVPLVLLDRLGYVPTMVLYVAGLLVTVGRTRWWLTVPGTAVGVLLTAYGADALGVVLPDPLHLLESVGI